MDEYILITSVWMTERFSHGENDAVHRSCQLLECHEFRITLLLCVWGDTYGFTSVRLIVESLKLI